MAISGIQSLTAYIDNIKTDSVFTASTQKWEPEKTDSNSTFYQYKTPLRTLTPKPYFSLYSKEDVSATGTVGKTRSTKALEDISLNPVNTTSSEITDEQMERFLHKAFHVFDLIE